MAAQCTVNFLALFSLLLVAGADSMVDPSKNTFIVATILEEPYVMKKGKAGYEGYLIDLMEKIAKHAGFVYTIKEVPYGMYGEEQDGKWNGMIGQLIRKEVHIAAAPMTISAPRSSAIAFSEPYLAFGMTAIMTRAAASSVNTFADLANQTRISYGLVRGGATEHWFSTTTSAVYRRMWTEISKDAGRRLLSSLEEGVARVRQSDGRFAFIMESSTAQYWAGRRPCRLATVGSLRERQHYGLATARASPILDGINRALRALRNSGELETLKSKWWRSECNAAPAGTTAAAAATAATLLLSVTCSLLVKQ